VLLRLDATTQTFVVTSARSGEGKTTICLSLAALLASSNQRVLLIDANLRAPKLQKILGLVNPKSGLSDVLAGTSTLRDACQILGNGFVCIPAGPVPPDPQQLLMSGALDRLLKEARGLFDVILLDSSAVLESMDATLIAAKADGVIVVVGCGNVTQDEVRSVPEHLRAVGANVIGAVLNRVKGNRHSLNMVSNLRLAQVNNIKETSALVPLAKAASVGVPPN